MKSVFDWFSGKKAQQGERRQTDVPAAIPVASDDIDQLTGALKWHRFTALLEAEQQQAQGVLLVVDLSSRSQSLALTAGQKEEEILPWLAQAIRQAMRSDDLLAHVDGYRFAVLLRGAPQEVAEAVSNRILESVDDTIFMTAHGIAQLGVKVGGASFAPGAERDVVESAVSNLDKAREAQRPSVIL